MDCTVAMIGQDGQTHTLEVKTSSLFDAAAQARQCSWYQGDAVIEVRGGDRIWKVRGERVREWQATRKQPA
jgi:hypothetical protein